MSNNEDWVDLPLENDDWEDVPVEAPSMETPTIDNPSMSESALRGAAQGASLGFADELTGAGATLLDTLTGKNKDLSIVDDYRKHRDESRAAYDKAYDENPASYIAGSVAGSIALPLGAAKAGATGVATALNPTTLQGAAKLGATFGLGDSKADLTEGNIADAARDASFGAATAGIVHEAIPHVIKGVKAGGKKALTLATGLKEADVDYYIKNAPFVKNAKSSVELADELADKVGRLSVKANDLDNEAWEILSYSNKTISKDKVISKIQSVKDSLTKSIGLVGPDDIKANNVISSIEDDLRNKSVPNDMSLTDLREILIKIRNNIDWSVPSKDTSNKALKSLQGEIDDIIKSKAHTEYTSLMKEQENLYNSIDSIKQKFNIKEGPLVFKENDMSFMDRQLKNLRDNLGIDVEPNAPSGSYQRNFYPDNATATNLETAVNEKSIRSQRILDDLKKIDDSIVDEATHHINITNPKNPIVEKSRSIRDQVNDYLVSKRMQGGVTQGSRKVLGGLATGAGLAAGHPALAAMGAISGYVLDEHGRTLGRQILDMYLATDPSKLGKFAAPLVKAAKEGGNKLAISHSLLMSNPEYREMLESLISSEEDKK